MLPRNYFPGSNQSELPSDPSTAALYARAAASAFAQPQGSSLSQALQASAATAAAPSAALIESVIAQEQRERAILASRLSSINANSVASERLEALLLQRERENLLNSYAGLGRLDQASLAPSASGLPGAAATSALSASLGMGFGLNSLARGLATSQPTAAQQSLLLAQQSLGLRDGAGLIPDHLIPLVDGSERTGRKGRTGTFPQKLHLMLSELENEEGGREIASFLPHGRAFAIHKPKEFVKNTMPKYFRMSRFSSFQRQLNLYEFQRITEGPDKGAYYHELFLQGRPLLCQQIKRNKIKGASPRPNQNQQFPLGPGVGTFGLGGSSSVANQSTTTQMSIAGLNGLTGSQVAGPGRNGS